MPANDAPIALQVKDLHKSFRIPTHRVDSLKERIVRPFSARDYRELRALDGVSFEIQKGEFFGIVGRNGSGKSTLLKLLASIYRADRGEILLAGRLAPFIELGVGFNLELTARENVALNGVMMGLTPQQARSRLGVVVEFAELSDFVDLKLKNYSSGMLVRLAFSLMLQVDADIMLIDEVLAVGDAAFQQKCADAFHQMKTEGKTIVLVTHAMSTIETYCHRAMLISDGKIAGIGDPAEIGRRYLRLNFQATSDVSAETAGAGTSLDRGGVSINDAWIENASGQRTTGVEHGEPIRIRTDIEFSEAASEVSVGYVIANADGLVMYQFGAPLTGQNDSTELRRGETIKVSADLENPLAPGHYFVRCAVQQSGASDIYLYEHDAADFIVFGGAHAGGVLALDHEIESVATPPKDST